MFLDERFSHKCSLIEISRKVCGPVRSDSAPQLLVWVYRERCVIFGIRFERIFHSICVELSPHKRFFVRHYTMPCAHQSNLVPRASFPLTSGRKTRALGATISGMRHRCRCAVSRITRIRLFPLFFHNGCSQSSRFPTAGQGERSSGNEIDIRVKSSRMRIKDLIANCG